MQRVKMHAGPDLPSAQIATISGQFDRAGLMVTLESVDGEKVPGQGPIRGGVYSRDTVAVVMPGVHSVEIKFWSPNVVSEMPTALAFDVRAGHNYEIRVGRDPSDRDTFWSNLRKATIGGRERWQAWVIDLDAGNSVPLLNTDFSPQTPTPTPLEVLPPSMIRGAEGGT
jgi:hypothetical protein